MQQLKQSQLQQSLAYAGSDILRKASAYWPKKYENMKFRKIAAIIVALVSAFGLLGIVAEIVGSSGGEFKDVDTGQLVWTLAGGLVGSFMLYRLIAGPPGTSPDEEVAAQSVFDGVNEIEYQDYLIRKQDDNSYLVGYASFETIEKAKEFIDQQSDGADG